MPRSDPPPMIQFLIDECLTPELVRVAAQHGFGAYHVSHRGWNSKKDSFLLQRLLEDDLTLVTNNWKDFRPMLRRARLHAGAVVVPNVALTHQRRLFDLALRAIRIAEPPLDMVNTVIEVDVTGRVEVYDLPEP
jgi:predicted nuclease of predicted toxin-antitoxin system